MFIQATLDPFLATSQLLPYRGVHSKTLLVLGEWTLSQSIKRRCTPRVFEFFHAASKIPAPRFAWLRTSKTPSDRPIDQGVQRNVSVWEVFTLPLLEGVFDLAGRAPLRRPSR